LELIGIKTIWLLPVFNSTSDHGYDTIDYYQTKESYGTIESLKNVTKEANKRGIKIILDLVANHCGSKHKWFSDQNPAIRKDKWFNFANRDLKWGRAWPSPYSPTWRRDPYPFVRNITVENNSEAWYYAAFDSTMPDFNYNNPDSRKEIISEFVNIMRFWIENTGVSGFR
jgi:glycosidase